MTNFLKHSSFLLSSLLLLTAVLSAQEGTPAYGLVGSIPVKAKFFTTDKLRQLYLVTPDNAVVKYSPDGKELFRYNNNTLGDLTHVDATNPFSLLLYYPGFQTAITLDRTLNKLDEFNLWNLQVVDVQAIAMAVDNGLWLFDGLNYALKKISRDGKLLRQSDNLSLLLGTTPAPNHLVARGNFVYLNDPDIGIMVFDAFGQYHRTLPLTGIHDFQVLEGRLLYQLDDTYQVYSLMTFREAKFPLPPEIRSPRQIRVQKDRLYVLLEEQLNIYSER